MLVLSRKKDERIFIGEGENRIEILVVHIGGDKVKLGIIAPKEMSVHRHEVQNEIDQRDTGDPGA